MRRIKSWCIRLLARVARQGDPDAFLIPAHTGLGNFIMMTPMVLRLRALKPASRIYILAGNPFGTEQVFRRGDGIVDDVFFLPASASFWKKAIFFWRMRALRIGTAFLPFDASPAFCWWGMLVAGIPRRVGHTFEVLGQEMGWTREVLTDPVPLRLDAHESDLHFDLLDRVAGPVQRSDATHLASRGEQALEKFGLRRGEYIALQVSAANATTTPKRWPEAHFAELIRRLTSDGETVVLPGDVPERPVIDEMLRQHQLEAINLAGRTNIEEVSAIIQHAKLLVCNDSGLMHIGNAHRTPLIALYGPTDDTFTAPRAATSRMLRAPLPCAPCMKNFAKTEAEAVRDCPINVQCMRDISVEEVYAACQQLLRKGEPLIA
jgi:lipopolysaccharide heptosyltransferase II